MRGLCWVVGRGNRYPRVSRNNVFVKYAARGVGPLYGAYCWCIIARAAPLSAPGAISLVSRPASKAVCLWSVLISVTKKLFWGIGQGYRRQGGIKDLKPLRATLYTLKGCFYLPVFRMCCLSISA